MLRREVSKLTGTSNGRGRGKTQQFAVEKFGVAEEVLELYRQKLSAKKISAALAEKGIKIAPLGINRWLAAQRGEDSQTTEIQSKERYDLIVTDYKKEILSILDEVKDIKNQALDEKDLKIYDKLVGRLYQGLELLAKLSGDAEKPQKVDVKIIINEINQQEFKERRNLRNSIHANVIDVEAEIEESDKEAQEKLDGDLQ